jgi:plastocyanin
MSHAALVRGPRTIRPSFRGGRSRCLHPACLPLVGTSTGLTSSVRGATHAVEIGDGFFSPASLTVAVGDTITWMNGDDSPHTVTGGAFDSGNLDAGGSPCRPLRGRMAAIEPATATATAR